MTQNQKKKKETYFLGNILRGFVSGEFYTPETAWKALCKKFNSIYPSESELGRGVYMYKEVPIKSGNSKEPFDKN